MEKYFLKELGVISHKLGYGSIIYSCGEDIYFLEDEGNQLQKLTRVVNTWLDVEPNKFQYNDKDVYQWNTDEYFIELVSSNKRLHPYLKISYK
jgi:hypothetical protein